MRTKEETLALFHDGITVDTMETYGTVNLEAVNQRMIDEARQTQARITERYAELLASVPRKLNERGRTYAKRVSNMAIAQIRREDKRTARAERVTQVRVSQIRS